MRGTQRSAQVDAVVCIAAGREARRSPMLRARLVHQYNGAGQATLDRSSAELVAVKRDANQALCIPARTPACFRCSIVHLRIPAICLTQAPTRRVLTPHATRRQWRSGWSHHERVTKQQPRKCRAPNHGAGHRGRPISEAESNGGGTCTRGTRRRSDTTAAELAAL